MRLERMMVMMMRRRIPQVVRISFQFSSTVFRLLRINQFKAEVDRAYSASFIVTRTHSDKSYPLTYTQNMFSAQAFNNSGPGLSGS